MKKYQLILGSASPRRQELLKYLYCDFDIHTADIEEASDYKDQGRLVMDIAEQKAKAVHKKIEKKYTNPFVIGADTIVCTENEILGKPKNKDHAREMLGKLSGKTHYVLTGVSLISRDKEISFYVKTSVEFSLITKDLMELYLATDEPMDKAGSYGIQAYALSFIKGVEGSYANVVGLPLVELLSSIKSFVGTEDWRSCFE